MKKRLQFLMGLVGSGLVLCIVCLVLEKRNADIRLILTVIFAINLSVWIGLLLKVSQPFQRFTEKATPFCRGEQSTIPTSEKYPEEFQRLANSVNRVAERRGLLSLSMEQSKYLGLQNQINPHFLYNTLDAIRGDALELHMDHIAAVTEALSTFFRYSVSNMEKIATVEEELGNVKDYFTIQKYRFGDKLNFNLKNKENQEVYNYCLPRLSLQPLVENAIHHGLEGREKMGSVEIYLQLADQDLIVCVIDDGVGMPFEKVDLLNEMLNENNLSMNGHHGSYRGIALNNVNERIKLLFGEQYGIHVFSEEQIGTEIRLIVPAILRSDYYQKRISTD